jgi:methylenetetrahydrofolate reductase (NADPH)
MKFIHSRGDFTLAGACYPEGHVENGSIDQDIEACKAKVDAGASFLISQLFFDVDTFLSYRDRALKAGIDVPIVPGIMPVTNVVQLERFTKMCGSSIPTELRAQLDSIREDRAAVVECGIEWAANQCRELLEQEAPGIHFYTLNRSHSSRIVWERLRFTAAPMVETP